MHTPRDSLSGLVSASVPMAAEAVLRFAADELERRIRNGEAAGAEEYLDRHPALAADAELALDLIYVEYSTRRDIGQTPSREEFFNRFPKWRAQLDRQFQLEELLGDPTPPGTNSAGDSCALGSATRGEASDGRFRILRLHARGGIGQVMRAVDTELNREVAIKELQPALAERDEVRERFLREAEITGKLEHPGIVPVYGLGGDGEGRPFYAMRLVRGQSFQEAITKFHQGASGSLRFAGVEFQKLLRRFLHVCETVTFAHSRGVIHRDLKPANILLGPFGETLVVDWGLARATGPEGPQQSEDKPEPPQLADSLTMPVAHWSNELTRASGELIGTPAFMSPEQAKGTAHEIGPAGDVYSLGATLYVLLTGRAPFVGTDIRTTLEHVAQGRFARPRELNRAIPRALEAVCLKAMALRPRDRYPSPRELASDLEHWLADEPVTAARELLVAKLARWGRRNRTHVVAAALALLLVTVISLAAALRINNERLRADRERIEADRRNARLAFDRGFALTAEHEHGAAMLWFTRALTHSPPDDEAMRRVILTNINAAQHHLLRRERVFNYQGRLTAPAFSPDGKHLLTTADSKLGIIWKPDSGTVAAKHPLTGGRVAASGFSADGDALVATYQRGSLLVHRLPAKSDSDADPPLVIAHSEEIAKVSFDPRGRMVAVAPPAGRSAKTHIWNLTSGELFAVIDHPSTADQIVFPPSADVVAIIHLDGSARLWQLPEKRLVCTFSAAPARILRVTFTPDGKRLLSGDDTGSISCWNAENGQRLFDLARHSGNVTALACSSDGQTVAAAWDTGATRTWNLETRRPASELLRLDRFTRNLTFRPGKRQLIIAAALNELVLWELPDLTRVAPPLNQQRVLSVAFSRDGKVAATGSAKGTVRLRDGATGKSFGKILSHGGPVTRVAFRPPDNAVVLTASQDGTARLWNAFNGEPHGQLMQHRSTPASRVQVDAAAFSPDGKVVVTGDLAGIVRLWNGDTGELVRVVDDWRGSVISICISPSGEQIVAGLGPPDNSVVLWDVAGGAARWESPHEELVRSVAISPDGHIVLSASNDETARFWDIESGRPVGPVLGHHGEVWVASFSPDGRTAVTGGYDAIAKLWSVPFGEPIGEPMRHEGIVMSAAFSTDGKRLLTGSSDLAARLWDVATCLPLTPPVFHGDFVRAVGISPAGDTALTGRVWPLPVPMPDDPPLIDLWVKLATERAFIAGENIEWLDRTTLDELANEFAARTGKGWREWADDRNASSDGLAP